MRVRVLGTLLSACSLALSAVVAVPQAAHAVDPEPDVCTVSGNVLIAPGVNLEPQYQRFRFISVGINCLGLPVPGKHTGAWAGLTAVGGSFHPENCAAGVGAGHFTGGNSPSQGAVTGGVFYYVRVGALVVAAGGLRTAFGTKPVLPPPPPGGYNHAFAAVLVFWPGTTTPPALPTMTCGAKLLGHVVTQATITGVAVVWKQSLPPLPEPGHPCPLAVDPTGVCKGHPFPF